MRVCVAKYPNLSNIKLSQEYNVRGICVSFEWDFWHMRVDGCDCIMLKWKTTYYNKRKLMTNICHRFFVAINEISKNQNCHHHFLIYVLFV